jgi:hypothetical protein
MSICCCCACPVTPVVGKFTIRHVCSFVSIHSVTNHECSRVSRDTWVWWWCSGFYRFTSPWRAELIGCPHSNDIVHICFVNARDVRNLDVADIVWSPWSLNGCTPISDDPLLGYGRDMCLDMKKKITFMDETLEVSFLSKTALRYALVTASIKGVQVGQVGGVVFALADRYCCVAAGVPLPAQDMCSVP